jgi:hypothetical protein
MTHLLPGACSAPPPSDRVRRLMVNATLRAAGEQIAKRTLKRSSSSDGGAR